MSERLLPGERIRRRVDFERVYQQGAKRHGRFMTVFLLKSDGPLARLGIAATRKIGGSVERNRAKRIAREIFRRRKPAPGTDLVIIPRREFLSAEFPSLERDYAALVSPRRGSVPAGPAAARPPAGAQ